ncbi:MAG: A/G-specific adenine glycosylase [Saprospiraceae bacterium]|nr:A/G-specific adenine glycosylase [Saprospiraceae bacterium]
MSQEPTDSAFRIPHSAFDHSAFGQRLRNWAAEHPRPLPWKDEPDPYRIWLSEILLQQTRVAQGLPYYERFVAAYPTVAALAAAPEAEVLKLWEGLGYYTRAKNLHAAAKKVVAAYDGVFPASYDALLALPGVGAYTAAAIASFAFNLPHAVLDGNVFRVLARIWGYVEPIDRPEARVWFAQKAHELLDPEHPGAHNQAIMDFGATWCTPRNPKCGTCPMAEGCAALQNDLVDALPRKSPKAARRRRIFLYAVIRQDARVYMRERMDKDIWQNLWEFPAVEVDKVPPTNAEIARLVVDHFFSEREQKSVKIDTMTGPLKQVLTHQEVHGFFVQMTQNDPDWRPDPTRNWHAAEQLTLKKIFAKPRLIDRFLTENPVYLTLF